MALKENGGKKQAGLTFQNIIHFYSTPYMKFVSPARHDFWPGKNEMAHPILLDVSLPSPDRKAIMHPSKSFKTKPVME